MQEYLEMDLTEPRPTHPPEAGLGEPNRMPAVEGHLVSSERRKKIYIKCLLCAMTLSVVSFLPVDPPARGSVRSLNSHTNSKGSEPRARLDS